MDSLDTGSWGNFKCNVMETGRSIDDENTVVRAASYRQYSRHKGYCES